MALFAEQATVATAQAWIDRVRMAMLNHAQFRVGAGDDVLGYASLGKAIMNSPESYATRFAHVCATQPVTQTGIAASPTDGAAVADVDILSAVETVYPGFAR